MLQRELFALPGQNLAFLRDRVTPAQVFTTRPSSINALLIQNLRVVVPDR